VSLRLKGLESSWLDVLLSWEGKKLQWKARKMEKGWEVEVREFLGMNFGAKFLAKAQRQERNLKVNQRSQEIADHACLTYTATKCNDASVHSLCNTTLSEP